MRESEPVLHATGEPDAIIRENRVDLVGRCRYEIAQELACNPLASLCGWAFGSGRFLLSVFELKVELDPLTDVSQHSLNNEQDHHFG